MLPKQNRLTSTKDFQNVTKTGVRVYSDVAVIYALANPTSQKNSQVGLIVSKVVGNSVVRHKVSRHIRSVVKDLLETIPGNIQIVIRALPAITEKDFTELNKILSESINKSIVKANV
jgi:ribonuclease P protein component